MSAKAKITVYVDGVAYLPGDEIPAEVAKLITNDAVLDQAPVKAPAKTAK